MPDFEKSALVFNYGWGETEMCCRHELYNEEDLINRANGYHMLDFINRFMALNGLISQGSFNRAEILIYHYMPKRIKSRGEMKLWLSRNWNRRF